MLYAFVKVFYDALQFPYGVVKNQHFQSSYFGGRRGSQKRVSLQGLTLAMCPLARTHFSGGRASSGHNN